MKTSRQFLVAGIVLGALLTLAPLAGVLGTVLGMMQEFNELRSIMPTSDTAVVSGSFSLLPTIVSILLCPIGITLLLTSLKFLRRLSTPPLPFPAT